MTEDEVSKLKAFARELIRLSWDDGVDGGDIEALATKHGLLVPVNYDPLAHGFFEDADAGDEVYVFSEWMKNDSIEKE